jgi:hypothetical protein
LIALLLVRIFLSPLHGPEEPALLGSGQRPGATLGKSSLVTSGLPCPRERWKLSMAANARFTKAGARRLDFFRYRL